MEWHRLKCAVTERRGLLGRAVDAVVSVQRVTARRSLTGALEAIQSAVIWRMDNVSGERKQVGRLAVSVRLYKREVATCSGCQHEDL